MTDKTMDVPKSTLDSLALSDARVAAMIELTPEQLHLVADWLTAESNEPLGAAMRFPGQASLALQSLTEALNDFAYLCTYETKLNQVKPS